MSPCQPKAPARLCLCRLRAGEGIYFAAKSGRMCAEAIVEASKGGKQMVGEDAFRVYLDKCAQLSSFASLFQLPSLHPSYVRLCWRLLLAGALFDQLQLDTHSSTIKTPRNLCWPLLTTPAAAARRFDKKYWATYKVLDILQKVFYRSNPAREAFVEMCESDYVQKMTFDSYLYKTVVPGNPLDDVKLLVQVRRRCIECFCFASPFPAAPWLAFLRTPPQPQCSGVQPAQRWPLPKVLQPPKTGAFVLQ